MVRTSHSNLYRFQSGIQQIDQLASSLSPTFEIFKNSEHDTPKTTLGALWRFFDQPYGIPVKPLDINRIEQPVVYFIPVLVSVHLKHKNKARGIVKERYPYSEPDSTFPFIHQILAFHDKHRTIPWDLSCNDLDLHSSVFAVKWIPIPNEKMSYSIQEFLALYSLENISEILAQKDASVISEPSQSLKTWSEAVKMSPTYILPSLAYYCQNPLREAYNWTMIEKTNRPSMISIPQRMSIQKSIKDLRSQGEFVKTSMLSANIDTTLDEFFGNDMLRQVDESIWEPAMLSTPFKLSANYPKQTYFDSIKTSISKTRAPVGACLDPLVFIGRSNSEFYQGWFSDVNQMQNHRLSELEKITSLPCGNLFIEIFSDF